MPKPKYLLLTENNQRKETTKSANYTCKSFIIVGIKNKRLKRQLIKTCGVNFLFNKYHYFPRSENNKKNLFSLNFSSNTDPQKKRPYLNSVPLRAWMEAHIISLLPGGLS